MGNLTSQLLQPGPEVYYTQGFRRVFEDHLSIVRRSPETTLVGVEPPGIVQHYKGDFYGLLVYMNVVPHMQWYFLRINGLSNPLDYDGIQTEIIIPDTKYIESLQRSYRTKEELL